MGMVLNASSFVLLPLIAGGNQLYVVAAIHSIGEAAVSPPMMALLAESISPMSHGLTYGLYGAGEDVGVLLGPIISSHIYQYGSPALAFNVFAIVMLAGAFFAFILLKKIKKNSPN